MFNSLSAVLCYLSCYIYLFKEIYYNLNLHCCVNSPHINKNVTK